MQECTAVLFHRKKTKINHKNVRKTCYWKLIFVICSYSTWRRKHARNVGTWARNHVRHVGTWARNHARHVGTWARNHARHAGTWARKHARNVGTRARKHVRHVGTWARKHARRVGTWACKARNLADSFTHHYSIPIYFWVVAHSHWILWLALTNTSVEKEQKCKK